MSFEVNDKKLMDVYGEFVRRDIVATNSNQNNLQLFYCNQCLFTTNCRGVLKVHKNSHRGVITCQLCDYTCDNDKDINKHMLVHTEVKLYGCNICPEQFSKMSDLKRHIQTHTDMMGNPIGDNKKKKISDPRVCPLCLYKSVRPGDMVKHLRIHTGEKPYSCSECDFKCSTSGSLQRHSSVHSGEKPYFCSQCDYRCSAVELLREHMKNHSGDKPFVCNICGYKCTRAGNLDRHMRKHTGERPFACSLCGYKCSQAGNLKEHMKTHSEDKQFFCTECPYKCTRASNLDRHMKTHPGKLLTCLKCNHQTSCAMDFQKHYKTHFQKHRFMCSECDFSCFDPHLFVTHNKIKERDSNQESDDDTISDPCNGVKRLACIQCNYICVDMTDLGHHINQQHSSYFASKESMDEGSSDDDYRSFASPSTFNSISDKTQHNESQNPSPRYIGECSKNSSEEEKPVICLACGLVCVSTKELEEHLKTHRFDNTPIVCPNELKPLVCLECGFSTSYLDEYNEHKNCHLVEKLTQSNLIGNSAISIT